MGKTKVFSLTKQLTRAFVIAACVVVSNSAHALLIDVIGDTTSERIVDGARGDRSSEEGIISGTFRNVDDFLVVATIGQSKPEIGSAVLPMIELSPVEVNQGAGTIRIVVYDDDFMAENDPWWDFTVDSVIESLHPQSTIDGSSISVSAYIDIDNNYLDIGIFEEGELFDSLNGTGSIHKTFPGAPLTAPYGLALVVDITHTNRRRSTRRCMILHHQYPSLQSSS